MTRIFDDRLEIDGEPGNYSDHAGLVVDLELQRAPATARPAPSRDVFDLAARVVAEGESLAAERQTGNRRISGAGIGLAAVAALSTTPKGMSRRKLLRGGLAAAALLALTPGVGFSIVSEVLVPDDIRAFQEAATQLAQLRPPLHVASR